MKKVLVLVLVLVCVGGTLNVSAQKDTLLIGDSTSSPKKIINGKCFAVYKGKKIRAAKSDKGKKAFVIYNTNAAGERRISKIYYAN